MATRITCDECDADLGDGRGYYLTLMSCRRPSTSSPASVVQLVHYEDPLPRPLQLCGSACLRAAVGRKFPAEAAK